MKHFLEIFSLGQYQASQEQFTLRLALTHFVLLGCFLINCVGLIFDSLFAYSYELFCLDSIGVLFYGVLFAFFQITRRQAISALVFFFTILVFIFYMSCYLGKDTFVALYLFNLIIIVFFLFDYSSQLLFFLIGLIITAVLMLEYSDYNFIVPAELSPIEVMALRLFALGANMSLFLAMVFVIEHHTKKMRRAIESERIRAIEMSERLQMLCNLKEEYNTSLLQQLDAMLVSRNDLKSTASISSLRSEERERLRIGRELSQSVGEILMKVKLRMGNLSSAIVESDRYDFEETMRIVDLATDDIKRFSELLDPIEFKHLKLDGALRAFVKDLKRRNDITFQYLNVGYTNQLSSEQELLIYRMVCDLIMEIVENSDATNCDLRMEVLENYMTIRIHHNAPNYTEQQRMYFFNAYSFHDRMLVVGGFVHAKTEIGQGSVVLLELPVPIMADEMKSIQN